jgi:4-hydroxythreonine-4-phosphate dehydrogenase
MPDDQHADLPPLAPVLVTMGDPCGVGPEVTHRAVSAFCAAHERDVFVIGNAVPFARCLGDNAAMHHYHIVPYDDFSADPELLAAEFHRMAPGERKPFFLELGSAADNHDDLVPGIGSVGSGRLAVCALEAAIELMNWGASATLVTAPLAKHWVREAGFSFPGHTECLGDAFKADPLMVLAGGGLRVALVSVHLPLRQVPAAITTERVEWTVRAFANTLSQDFGLERPRIAVCGLNPHAGESGRMGDEETSVIAPVVGDLAAQGFRVSGPYAADSLFHKAAAGAFDGVVAMYHDQGLIPVKLLAFDTAVNLTGNLPIVRTSPDHGTAYDIAGKGKASHTSMLAALEMADAVSARRAANMPHDAG